MSTRGATPGGDGDALSALLAEVVAARSREHAQLRQPGARPDAVQSARLDTLGALLDYADAIQARSWPVPRGILQEIRLHQALTLSRGRPGLR
jgi:hypothetical protein